MNFIVPLCGSLLVVLGILLLCGYLSDCNRKDMDPPKPPKHY